MLRTMKRELDIIKSKVRFIEEFISGEINILHKEDDEIYKQQEIMSNKQIWDLPIVDSSNKLIGLLHRHDVN